VSLAGSFGWVIQHLLLLFFCCNHVERIAAGHIHVYIVGLNGQRMVLLLLLTQVLYQWLCVFLLFPIQYKSCFDCQLLQLVDFCVIGAAFSLLFFSEDKDQSAHAQSIHLVAVGYSPQFSADMEPELDCKLQSLLHI
jgi:hypothetical protein